MAFRGSKRSFRRFRSGKRDYIWTTTRVEQTIADDALVSITNLVAPSDWEASTTGFDRGTLLGIRGWLATLQSAAATTADQTMVASFIIKNSSAASTAFSPLAAASYDSSDVLWCGGQLLQSSAASDRARYDMAQQQVFVKSKRKLTSADTIDFVTAMDVDTVSPTYFISGILRCLIQRA